MPNEKVVGNFDESGNFVLSAAPDAPIKAAGTFHASSYFRAHIDYYSTRG